MGEALQTHAADPHAVPTHELTLAHVEEGLRCHPKLGMRDRVELTRYAIRRGLVQA